MARFHEAKVAASPSQDGTDVRIGMGRSMMVLFHGGNRSEVLKALKSAMAEVEVSTERD